MLERELKNYCSSKTANSIIYSHPKKSSNTKFRLLWVYENVNCDQSQKDAKEIMLSLDPGERKTAQSSNTQSGEILSFCNVQRTLLFRNI